MSLRHHGLQSLAAVIFIILFIDLGEAGSRPALHGEQCTVLPNKNFNTSTDATSILQQAIDREAGGCLDLHGITVSFSQLTMPKKGIRLVGSGAVLSAFFARSSSNSLIIIPTGSSNVDLSDFTLVGPISSSGSEEISGIVSNGKSSRINISNVTVSNIPRNAIVIRGGDARWSITNSKIKAAGRFGIVVDFLTEPVNDLEISDNVIESSGLAPISFISNSGGNPDRPSAGVWGARVLNNKVIGNGMGIGGYSPYNRDIIAEGNEISTSGIKGQQGHAMHWGGSNIIIRHNLAQNTALSAIVISSWPNSNPTPSSGFEIVGNVISGVASIPNGKGILVQNASNGLISDNFVTGAPEEGIKVTGNALNRGGFRVERIEIKRNVIVGKEHCLNSPRTANVGVVAKYGRFIDVEDNQTSDLCSEGIQIVDVENAIVHGNHNRAGMRNGSTINGKPSRF